MAAALAGAMISCPHCHEVTPAPRTSMTLREIKAAVQARPPRPDARPKQKRDYAVPAAIVVAIGFGIIALTYWQLLVGMFGLALAFALAFGAYFLPAIIAAGRGHPNGMPIAVVNALLGWTLIGYVVALAWSLSSTDRNP
ncbi:MAG TPA: superinfection immunity protein [Pirellulales bacterium]